MRADDDDLGYVSRATTPGLADPAATAIASLLLGGLSLAGFGMLNGSTYVLPLTQGQSSTVRTVLAGLVGALLALVAVGLGVFAKSRSHPGDPSWVPRIAQAGTLVAGIAFALRLVATATGAAQVAESGFFAPL